MIVSNYEEQGLVVVNDTEIHLVSYDEVEGVVSNPGSSTYNSSVSYDGDYPYNQSITLVKSAMADILLDNSDIYG